MVKFWKIGLQMSQLYMGRKENEKSNFPQLPLLTHSPCYICHPSTVCIFCTAAAHLVPA
jgi:hypothetical protein